MIRSLTLASLLAIAAATPAAAAVQSVEQAVAGTRLDVVATGEVNRVPDVARISAGVVTLAPSATDAIRQNAQKMRTIRTALRGAGVEERDIQTSTINLHPEYRHAENQSPQLIGYRAANEVSVRFRDVANTGRILDALVAQGANQINGPMLSVDRPEAALDEARTIAVRNARARADLYARALGMRVRRILSVSEAGASYTPMPRPMMREMAAGAASDAMSNIAPGEQTLTVSLTVSFELE